MLRFDKKIEEYLDGEIMRLKNIGIYPATRPMVLRYIIEMQKKIRFDIKRKPRSRDIIINLK